MKLMVVSLSVAIVSLVGLFGRIGNAELLKCLCVVSTAVAAAQICHLRFDSRIGSIVFASGASTAALFALLAVLLVFMRPMPLSWESWKSTIGEALYLALAAAAFFGFLGGCVGLGYAVLLRSLKYIAK